MECYCWNQRNREIKPVPCYTVAKYGVSVESDDQFDFISSFTSVPHLKCQSQKCLHFYHSTWPNRFILIEMMPDLFTGVTIWVWSIMHWANLSGSKSWKNSTGSTTIARTVYGPVLSHGLKTWGRLLSK